MLKSCKIIIARFTIDAQFMHNIIARVWTLNLCVTVVTRATTDSQCMRNYYYYTCYKKTFGLCVTIISRFIIDSQFMQNYYLSKVFTTDAQYPA